ncbi:50S ribosomal protein L6 [Candidatus Micrarchaeota archaeon]|nr:MAG: 50S ribosomal protein L6 [Candidatus Micrarchaeota archaeon]
MSTSIKMPEGVKAQVEGTELVVSGKAGSVRRPFDPRKLSVEVKGDEVVLSGKSTSLLNAYASHVRNMAKGASEGYSVNMQVVHSHFPISVEAKGNQIFIKNFIGEKKPRIASIVGSTKVAPKGQTVIISGPSKEDVGQTVSNIRSALRIGKRDSRIFQDGLYVVES